MLDCSLSSLLTEIPEMCLSASICCFTTRRLHTGTVWVSSIGWGMLRNVPPWFGFVRFHTGFYRTKTAWTALCSYPICSFGRRKKKHEEEVSVFTLVLKLKLLYCCLHCQFGVCDMEQIRISNLQIIRRIQSVKTTCRSPTKHKVCLF